MAESGYSRGADGVYSSPSEGRVNLELKAIQSPQNEAERAIMADGWRRAGFEVEEAVFTLVETQDRQLFANFRSFSTSSSAPGGRALTTFTTASAAKPENRWFGNNRGGWSNPEYDRLVEGTQTTLDRSERIRQAVGAAAILSEQLGTLPLYFNPGVLAYPSGLSGVNVKSADTETSWNMHVWEFG